MKKNHLRLQLRSRVLLLALIASWISATQVDAQFSPRIEKGLDEYYTEILKVYKIIESEEVDVALRKMDDMKPTIERKARELAEIAESDPEILRILDADDSFEVFQDKPYYIGLMRIAQSENFQRKMRASSEIGLKLETLENIIETYTQDILPSEEEPTELATGVAFTLTLNGKGKFTGTHHITADFEEGAIAYIDDLDYLRIDIYGEVEGKEASVSFFVDNKGTGRQEWATEGHFVFEMMDPDGELLMSLWGNEEMGYFDITSVEGPGGFVTGKIHGNCMDGDSDTEITVPITATFKAGYIKNTY